MVAGGLGGCDLALPGSGPVCAWVSTLPGNRGPQGAGTPASPRGGGLAPEQPPPLPAPLSLRRPPAVLAHVSPLGVTSHPHSEGSLTVSPRCVTPGLGQEGCVDTQGQGCRGDLGWGQGAGGASHLGTRGAQNAAWPASAAWGCFPSRERLLCPVWCVFIVRMLSRRTSHRWCL